MDSSNMFFQRFLFGKFTFTLITINSNPIMFYSNVSPQMYRLKVILITIFTLKSSANVFPDVMSPHTSFVLESLPTLWTLTAR